MTEDLGATLCDKVEKWIDGRARMVSTLIRNKHRILLAGVVLAVVLAGTAILLLVPGSQIQFQEQEDLIVVRTPVYEIAFHADRGGIAYIKERTSGQILSSGNREDNLWWAFMADESSHRSTESEQFTYEWSNREKKLTFRYESPIVVRIEMDFTQEDRVVMQAFADNQTAAVVESFRFPYELRFDINQADSALLPMLPGAKLNASFFKENNSFEGQYPGMMFAAYTALQLKHGTLVLFDIHEGPIATLDVGFKSQVDDAQKSAIVHNYKTWIEQGGQWISPKIVVMLSDGYEASISAYRMMNRIDEYRGIEEKLGEQMKQYAAAPLYKLDIAAIGREDWNGLRNKWLDTLEHAGIIHLVGFQEGGHDEHYPDFIPPASKWGGEDDFREFVAYAQQKGHLVIPYTNFSWWSASSPTLANLPANLELADIVVRSENGMIIKEEYGPHIGYVVNPNHPFVRDRIAEEHKELIEEAGFDGIFEDQWGARNAPYVFNKEVADGTDPSNAYFEGVRQYFRSIGHQMFVEVGIDVLADDSTGFLGTNYLWDLLGYRTKTDQYTEYFPMAGMLLRDKVLLYQHNLAFETMTHSKAMLRWNLAQGYQLSMDLLNGTENPWVDVAGVFQNQVLAHYASELVDSFEHLDESVTRTVIGDYTITANWHEEEGYAIGDFTLAPGGVESVNRSGSVRGGVYTRYNGKELDPGDHYLVEVREEDHIRIYQPMGADTTISIRKGDKWPHARVAAYQHNGSLIAELPVAEEGDYVTFDYIGIIYDQEVGYVQIDRSDTASEVKEVPFSKQAPKINLALGKPIVSSTDTTQDFPAWKANDGDHYTYWESMPNRFPQQITVDLGDRMKVQSVVLTLPPLDVWEAREQEIEVLISDDGDPFTTLVGKATYTYDPRTGNRVEIPLGEAEARFVRVVVSGNTGWPAAQVSELEVY